MSFYFSKVCYLMISILLKCETISVLTVNASNYPNYLKIDEKQAKLKPTKEIMKTDAVLYNQKQKFQIIDITLASVFLIVLCVKPWPSLWIFYFYTQSDDLRFHNQSNYFGMAPEIRPINSDFFLRPFEID